MTPTHDEEHSGATAGSDTIIPPAASLRSLLSITHPHVQQHQPSDDSNTAPARLNPTSPELGDVELGGVYDDAEGTGISSSLPPNALEVAELTHSDFVLLATVHDAWNDHDETAELRAVLEAIPVAKRRLFIDINMGDGLGVDDSFCALHHLVWDGKPEHVRVLLELGGNVDVVTIKPFSASDYTPYRQTPLHIACSLAQEDMVRLLCTHGADPNFLDSGGLSPLQRLVEKRTSPMDKVLRCLKIMLPLAETDEGSPTSFSKTVIIPVNKTQLQPGALINVLVSRAKTNEQAAEAIEYLVKAGFSVSAEVTLLEDKREIEEGLPSLNRHQKNLRQVIFFSMSLLSVGAVAGYLSKYGKFDVDSCETIFGEIILTPYLVLMLNQFLFRFLKWGFEMSLLPLIYRTLSVYCCACCFKRDGPSRNNGAAADVEAVGGGTVNPISNAARSSSSISDHNNSHGRSHGRSHTSSHATSRTQSWSRPSHLGSFSFRRQKMDSALRGLKAYIRQTKNATYKGSDALLTTPWLFLYFQALAAYFVVLFTAVWCRTWAGPAASSFDTYTTFYGILVNSAFTTSITSLWIFFMTKKERRTAAAHRAALQPHPPRDLSWSLRNLYSLPYRHLMDLLDDSTFSSRLQQLRHAWRSDKVVVLKLGDGLREGGLRFRVGCATLARFVTAFLAVQVLIVIPPLLSHLIPACALYGWIVLCGTALSLLSRWLMHSLILSRDAVMGPGIESNSGRDDIRVVLRDLSHLLTKILQRFAFIWMMQTLFNYAALWFADPSHDYFGVVSHEFDLRSQSYCFLFKLTNTRVRGTIMLLSWV